MYVMDNLIPLREILLRIESYLKNLMCYFLPKDAIETSMRSVDGIRYSAICRIQRWTIEEEGAIIPVYVKPAEKKEPPKAVLHRIIRIRPEAKAKAKEEVKEVKPEVKTEDNPEAEKIKPKVSPADSLKKKEDDKDKNVLKIVVFNSNGDTIRRMNQKLEEGWNTVTWDLRNKGVRFPSRGEIPKDADDPSGEYVVSRQV
jgi:hypothetical protein